MRADPDAPRHSDHLAGLKHGIGEHEFERLGLAVSVDLTVYAL